MMESFLQIVALLLFAFLLIFINMKTGEGWLKLLTMAGALGAIVLAGFLVSRWVVA